MSADSGGWFRQSLQKCCQSDDGFQWQGAGYREYQHVRLCAKKFSASIVNFLGDPIDCRLITMVSFKAPTIKSCVTSLVSPELPTAPENLHLAFSPADLADLRIFTPVILLYETPVDSEFETLVGNLKDSLRKVLVEYYPLAGRIAKGENGVAELQCDDRGAYFTQMVVEETLEEFGGRDACFGIMGMGAANLKCEGFQVYTLNEYKEIPPLVIQVSQSFSLIFELQP